MKICILTTDINYKISGGTIYNAHLYEFLNKYTETKIEIIEEVNTYPFDINCHYILDGIFISENIDLSKLANYSITFLIHLWPSILQSTTEKKQLFEQIEREIGKYFKLLFTGENSKKHLLDTLKIPDTGILIPPGVNWHWKHKKTFPDLPKKVIYLANFIEGKGHFRLLDALSIAKPNSLEIDCYGEILSDDYFQKFMAIKPKNINYQGKISHQDINALLLKYDLCFHFSDYESFGMGILEAIATHLPVLITPVGDYKDNQKLKPTGVLDTFDPSLIATKISEICTEKDKYYSLILAVSTIKVATWDKNFKPLLAQFNLK
ncbi:glycosyltransferase family 1 protein [Flavobacterium piscinae]|uniref:Glycosyltransferase family 1 protein n=1 Tax=Flavobacterium piscinae TaxID=2506424 RepID=A0A4Q1KXQ6_9FLAO|nr:glycosyltransferase family 4 protein [Flavobacterium piscinae]RXR34074.1 glycosyltransferase family 1 protein [Flavobacterium piscinae]